MLEQLKFDHTLIYLNFKKTISNREKGLSLILFGVFMVMTPILPSGNFFNNWVMAITFLPIGFYLSLIFGWALQLLFHVLF